MNLSDPDSSDLFWAGVGLLLCVALAAVLWSFLGTFVFALFLYYATRPVYRRLRQYVRQSTLAAGLALLVLAFPVVALVSYTVAIAVQELDKFVSRTDAAMIQPLLDQFEEFSELIDLVEDPGSLLSDPNLVGFLGDAADALLQYAGLFGMIAIQVFVMFALAFYLLRDGPRFGRWVGRFDDERGILSNYLRAIDRSLERIFYGALLNAVLTAIIGSIVFNGLTAVAPAGLAIPYPALSGVLAGLASLIPIVGMKLVYVPLVAYLAVRALDLGEGFWYVGVVFVVTLIVVDTIPDFIVRPYVSRGDLHVGLVMFAYIFGPIMFGWYGIFLGPILLVLLVHFFGIVVPAHLERPATEPAGVDPVYLEES